MQSKRQLNINKVAVVQGVPIPPPLHSQTRHRYIPKLYIFMLLYRFQIIMQVFMTIALLTYFRSHVLCVKVERIFMNDFSLYFWGDFPKMPTKSSIVGSDPYIIPHFKANMSSGMYLYNSYLILI